MAGSIKTNTQIFLYEIDIEDQSHPTGATTGIHKADVHQSGKRGPLPPLPGSPPHRATKILRADNISIQHSPQQPTLEQLLMHQYPNYPGIHPRIALGEAYIAPQKT